MSINTRALLLFLAVLLCACGIFTASYFFPNAQLNPEHLRAGTLLQPPQALPSFALDGTEGRVFNNASLRGHWTFMFFGFTECNSICPISMMALKNTEAELDKQHAAAKREYRFISIDPEDSLHTIAQYVHKFNPTFLGARGSDTQIENLTNALGIVYQRMNTQDKHKQYDHTGVILLVNPAGKLTALFSFPHNAVNIAHDFLEITLHDKTE